MKKVLVETSARHIHLTQADLETLFGKDYKLTPKKELSQPGQFACVERVDVVGPKKTLSGVSILGPVRKATQVELSLTDARSIPDPRVGRYRRLRRLQARRPERRGRADRGRHRRQAAYPYDPCRCGGIRRQG